MNLHQTHASSVAVLHVSGRVTADDAPALTDRLAAALLAHDHRLVVDLTAVDFMGSAGLGALIGAVKSSRAAQGHLVLVAPSGVAHTLLRVSGLLDFVTHAATVETAITMV